MSLATRLTALAQAIGADIKSLQAQINAIPSGGGGSDPWSHQALTTSYTNSTVTASDVFTGFVPIANTRYIVDSLCIVNSAAATTGVQTCLAGPTTGITRSAVKIQSASAAAADKLDHLALNAFQVATAGLVAFTLLNIQAIIEVGATPGAGNVRVQARSEVAGSAIAFHPGSSMRWRTI